MSTYSLAPYVPSSDEMVKKMLELAELKRDEVLYDLGSGDGRVLILAARDFGVKAVGVEMRDDLVKETQKKIHDLKLEDQVKIIQGNIMEADISGADVITFYLTDSGNAKLKPKLEKELKNGCRVISNSFEIPGWQPVKVSDASWYKIYRYLK